MRILSNRRAGLGMLSGLFMALLIVLGSEGRGGAAPPGGDFCPGGFPATCVRCANDDCVRACIGDFTCGRTDENKCWNVFVCD
jgi:hypothetical protein